MLDRAIRYFIDNTSMVTALTVLIVGLGLTSLFSMRRDLHPPMEFPEATVTAVLEGASSAEMERLVTFPIEEALRALPGMKGMTSVSRDSRTEVEIEFQPGFAAMSEALEMIRGRLDGVRHRLPASLRPIRVAQARQDSIYLSSLAIFGADPLNATHRLAARRTADQIAQIPGVSMAEIEMPSRDLHIIFNEERLRALGLSVSELRRAIAQSLQFTPVGRLRSNGQEIAVELLDAGVSPESIGRLVVSANRSGSTLRLSEVAKVEWRLPAEKVEWFTNGQQAIEITVMKEPDRDSIDLHAKVQARVEELAKELPAGVVMKETFDGPRFIKLQLQMLASNGLQGLILVVLILMAFLNWRVALLACAGIPISYLGAAAVLHQLGMGFDLLSIIGMIIVVGVLVDDAIIMAEGYTTNLERGMSPQDAAQSAARSLIVPVTGTVLTTMVAFLPILFIKSHLTFFLAAIPVVVIAALAFSWFETFFFMPNHLAHFVKKPQSASSRFFDSLSSIYKSLLRVTLRRRYIVSLVGLSFFFASLFVAATQMQHFFNLSIGQEQIRIYGELNSDASGSPSLARTRQAAAPIEAKLQGLLGQGVDLFTTVVGQQWRDGRREQSPELFQIVLQIGKDHPHPTELKNELLPKVRELIGSVQAEGKPGAFKELVAEERKRGQENLKKDMVSLRIEGELPVSEEQVLAAVREKVKFGPDEILTELVLDHQLLRKSWRFEPRTDALMAYGIGRTELAQQLADLLGPVELTQTRLGGEMVSIMTRVGDSEAAPDFKSLSRLEIRSARGASVPLGFIGRWTEEQGLQSIRHENGVRVFDVDFRFNVKKSNAEIAKAQLNQAGSELLQTFPGLKIKAKDANEHEAENRAWTLKLAATCIGLILMILFVVLGSFTQPLLVVVPIAMGVAGALWALYFHGHPLTLMAMIGILGLIGVAVNDSLVMVYSINELKERGDSVTQEAIIHGASSRLRAIFLVSVTSWVGVFPTAYGLGGESGFTQPIAFAMGWGLFTSTNMTLFLLPALLMVREDLARFAAALWQRRGVPAVAISGRLGMQWRAKELDFVPHPTQGPAPKQDGAGDSPLDSPPSRQ